MEKVIPKIVNSRIEALEYCYELLGRGDDGLDEERRAAVRELIDSCRAREEQEKAKRNLKIAAGRNFYIPPGL